MKLNYNKQRRDDMKSAGAYDGRFRTQIVKDKKKQLSKTWARKK